MTKQDKILGRIGPVLIRSKGSSFYLASNSSNNKVDKLLEFLNADTRNRLTIKKYCRENGYIINDISKDWKDTFIQEQNEARMIANKIMQGKIGNDELDFIVSKLNDMPIRYQSMTETELDKLNKDLFWLGEDYRLDSLQHPKPDSKVKSLVTVKHYLTLKHVIWDNLLTIVKQKRRLRQCSDIISCRRYFFPDKRRPDQKFCTPECEDRVRKRKK